MRKNVRPVGHQLLISIKHGPHICKPSAGVCANLRVHVFYNQSGFDDLYRQFSDGLLIVHMHMLSHCS